MRPTIFHGLLDLLAPPRCPACDVVLAYDDDDFCGACAPLLEPAPEMPDGVVAAYIYAGPLADAVRRFKYGRRSELAIPLGRRLVEVTNRLPLVPDAVVPVPLHPRRLRERGFDQAALLARPLARSLGVPLRTLLLRTRPTAVQASLPRAERPRNVARAFRVRASPPSSVVLVDDVRTTGATLAAAAEALRDGGCREVQTLVLARAES